MDYKEYQGVPVVTSDSRVKYLHPRYGDDPKRMPTLRGATLLLLEDGTFVVVCDEEGCGFNGITGRKPYVKPEGSYRSITEQASSVNSHKTGTHRLKPKRGRKPFYTEPAIRVIIKVWLNWKNSQRIGWAALAAAELDKMGIVPANGVRWTTSALAHVVRKYSNLPKYKNIKAGPMTEEDHKAVIGMIVARSTGGDSSVASNVRITSTNKSSDTHPPVDSAAMIAAKKERDEMASAVTTPTLTFSGPKAEPEPITISPTREAPVAAPQASSFQLVGNLPDGTVLFTYDNTLMAGKPVKSIEV